MSDVTFSFGGDASGLRRELQGIKDGLASVEKAASQFAPGIASAFVAAQGAIAAVRGAFDFVANIPAQASRFEDLRTVLAQVMGDAQKAGSLLRDLWTDAANGNVPLEDMATAARHLSAVMGDSGEIREWSNRLADISSGSKIAVEQLARVYSRMLQLNTVDTRTVEQLGKQDSRVYEELAKVVGVSSSAISAAVKSGQVSVEQLTQAFRNLTDEGGAYYKLSSQLSNTTGGSWSTMLESFNLLAAELGEPINDAIRPVLQEIGATLQRLGPQVREIGSAFGAAFQAAVAVVGPVASAIGSIVGALGGLKTVLAAAAAGLLLYATNARGAAASTVDLGVSVASLARSIKGISFAGVAAAVKGQLAGIRATLVSSLASMRVAWSVTMTTLVTVARASFIAIKASIVSSGIGLIIVGIGEALGALYSWFMEGSEAAREAAEEAERFGKALSSLDKEAGKVSSREGMAAFMDGLDERIDELKERLSKARSDDADDDRTRELEREVKELEKRKAHYASTLPSQVAAAEAAEREAAALKRQAEEAEELRKKLEQARERMGELVAEQAKRERDEQLEALPVERQIELRLSDAGFSSLEALKSAMDGMEQRVISDPSELDRYREMVEAYQKVVALRKRKRSEDAEAAQEARRAAEEQAQREEGRRGYEREVAMLEAEAAQDERRLALLERENRLAELTAEYRRRGYEDAEQMARRMVLAELDAQAAREKASSGSSARRMSASWIQSGKASVGGGGRSFLVGGDSMLQESKKHTELLEEVRDVLVKNKDSSASKVTVETTAVIGY